MIPSDVKGELGSTPLTGTQEKFKEKNPYWPWLKPTPFNSPSGGELWIANSPTSSLICYRHLETNSPTPHITTTQYIGRWLP
jgi:hypothetical protein